jgi:hypothetical protein
MSYASPQMIAGDPAFWSPKQAAAMKPSAATKPAAAADARTPEQK